MNTNYYMKQIKTASRIGLIGSVIVAAATIAWMMWSQYTFRQSPQVHSTLLVVCTLLAIGGMSGMLLTVRKRFPKLRQLEEVEERLQGYCAIIKGIYYGMFAVIVVICTGTVLMGDKSMLMMVLLVTLSLFMQFPNIYRMKVDMGLTDQQAKELFGNDYIPDEQMRTDDAEPEETENAETENGDYDEPDEDGKETPGKANE